MGKFKSDATTVGGFIADVSIPLVIDGGVAGYKSGEIWGGINGGGAAGGTAGVIIGLNAGIAIALSALATNNGKLPGDPNYKPFDRGDNPYTPPPGMPDYSPSGDDDGDGDPVLPPPPPELPWDRDLPPDPPVDPLVLDLDGDGIKTVAIDSNRYFDAEKRVLQQAYIGDQYDFVG